MTIQINRQLSKIAKQQNLVVAKRVYIENSPNKINSKVIVFDSPKSKVTGIPNRDMLSSNSKYANMNLLSNYAIFGNKNGNAQLLLNQLSDLGIQLYSWNPSSFRAVITDTVSNLQVFHFDYLIIIWLMLIILLSAFIIFQQKRKYIIVKLFHGQSSLMGVMSQGWDHIKWYFLKYSCSYF